MYKIGMVLLSCLISVKASTWPSYRGKGLILAVIYLWWTEDPCGWRVSKTRNDLHVWGPFLQAHILESIKVLCAKKYIQDYSVWVSGGLTLLMQCISWNWPRNRTGRDTSLYEMWTNKQPGTKRKLCTIGGGEWEKMHNYVLLCVTRA